MELVPPGDTKTDWDESRVRASSDLLDVCVRIGKFG